MPSSKNKRSKVDSLSPVLNKHVDYDTKFRNKDHRQCTNYCDERTKLKNNSEKLFLIPRNNASSYPLVPIFC